MQRFAASLWMRAADAKNRRYRKAAAKQALSNNQGCRKAEIRPIEPDAGNAAEGRFPIFYSFRFPLQEPTEYRKAWHPAQNLATPQPMAISKSRLRRHKAPKCQTASKKIKTMNLISSKLPKIQFITHSDSRYTTAESALLALSCGIRWIQFRLKHASLEEARPEAIRVQELCRSYKALFVIDDHVELAKSLKADGVHLGKTDMPIAEARKILGPDYLIGGTANTWEDMLKIKAEGGDYIGLGPYRFTTTKENLSPILGIEGYRSLMDKARQNQLDLPVYAIGGLQPQDCKALMECGVHGIAISSSILQAEDPQAKTKEFTQQVLY